MRQLPGLKPNILLAPYTTYKIGGPADWFVEVTSTAALVQAIVVAREANMAHFILGCGANILMADKGFRGLVIHNKAERCQFLPQNRLVAESGAIMADLIELCRDRELSGLEHYVGIPSSVGGALWQNLHFLTPDRQGTVFIEEVVEGALLLDEDNRLVKVDRDFLAFGYDDSILHHHPLIVLEVTFQLNPAPRSQVQKQMDENMAWRIARQPQLWEFPSCGSVFKKIEGVGAGRLIDEAGLKGTRVGNIEVSPKHANYFVNLGGATASDVLALMELVKSDIKAKTGYQLEPEISVIGDR